MNILLCGDSDNGGGSWFLAQAINRHTPYQARSVRGYQSYLKYPYDVLNPSLDEWNALVAWADLIHIRDRLPAVARRGTKLAHKPTVITYTGRHFRMGQKAVYKAHANGWRICVSTPDMMAFCPDVNPTWLPNPRWPMLDLWKPAKQFTVVQAPTARSAKQTDAVVEACKQAGVPLILIEKKSYSQCIELKRTAWATVDQFKYGYGNNAIEGWALGMPVVSGFRRGYGYRAAIVATCGDIPFAEAAPTVPSICAAIEQMRDDPRYYAEWQERGRDQFYTFHYAPVVAYRATQLYKELL